MQIARPIPGPDDVFCTLGFNALRDGVAAFITASHCTEELWAADSTPFHQSVVRPADYIGAELDDPEPVRTCHWGIFFNFPCRHSDAALSEYADDVDFAVGTIARTTVRSASSSLDGSTTIDSSNPYFDIFWVDKYPSHGETVHKMGVTTGWTSGTVERTCVTIWIRRFEKKAMCQYSASFRVDEGDSGSPVFKWSGGGAVTLTGVVSKWTWTIIRLYSSWFSPLGGIEEELGQLDVRSPQPPPPLSATISGPTIVEPGETETWWGSASGGTSPYSYEWSGVLSGTGSSITGEVWSTGSSLELTLTDADGNETWTNIIICVLEDGDDPDLCPH